jgi:hypothetical protein
MRTLASSLAVLCLFFSGAVARAAEPVTVLYSDRTTDIAGALLEPGALLVPEGDLERATGWNLEGAGLSAGGLAVAAPREGARAGAGAVVCVRDGKTYVDLLALARKIDQVAVEERERRVFGFGPVPALRASRLDTAEAPDFALQDRKGRTVRLSDFRGKKVLVITWASW